MKRSIIWLTMLGLSLSMGLAQASENYTLEYDEQSPIKNVDLSNTTLKLQMYRDGNPSGYLDVKTGKDKTFALDQAVDFEVISVEGEKKVQARCTGFADNEAKHVKITCQKY